MTLIELLALAIMAGLATGFVSNYAVHENGPWDIIARLRFMAGKNIRVDGEEELPDRSFIPAKDLEKWGMYYKTNGTVIANLISCDRCTSFWVAAGICSFVFSQYPADNEVVAALFYGSVVSVSVAFNAFVSGGTNMSVILPEVRPPASESVPSESEDE